MSTSGLSKNRNWQRLWRGEAISVFGDMIFMVTIMLWIATEIAAGKSWAPAAASGALIATAIPALVVGPIAGVWVDRWNRRRSMLVADGARVLLVASLLVIPLLRHTISIAAQLAMLYSVLATTSCFAQFFNPSRLALIAAVVDPADQTNASSQMQAIVALAQVLGPPLAAPLLVTFGVQWALIANALSFAISWLYVRGIKVPATEAPARSTFSGEFRAGIRFFASSKVLVGIAVGSVILMAGVGAVNSMIVFFIIDNLHTSAGWVGVLSAVIGVGAIGGAITTGLLANLVGLRRIPWLGLLVGGASVIALSRCTAIGPALAASFVLGITIGVINASDQPITLRVTPSQMLGRVSAVFSPLLQLANLIGMALAGFLASGSLKSLHHNVFGVTFGTYDTIFAGAGILFIAAALVTIRPMRHLPEAEPSSEADAPEADAALATT